MADLARALAIALPVLVGLALFAIAGLVAKYGGSHRHNRLFAALFFLSGIKSVSEGLVVLTHDPATGLVDPTTEAWTLLAQLCALAMLPLLFLFVASFPRPTRWMLERPWLGALAFVPSFGVLAVLLLVEDQATVSAVAIGFNVLSSGMTAAALVLLLRTRRRSPDAIERTQAGFVALGFVPSFVATWAISALLVGAVYGAIDPAFALGWIDVVLRYVSPVFEFLAAGLVGLAILRYNILGVSPTFRLGVKSVLVGSLFATVFVVTQAIESQLLEGRLFSFAGQYSFLVSAVTGLVLFKPIERVSERTAERLLPKPKEGKEATRAAEVYHAQCAYVLRDGNVSDREMAFLRNLRSQLGLSDGQARAIEEEVERMLKVDAPQTGASSGTAVAHVAKAHEELASGSTEVHRAGSPSGDGPAPPST